ncbi:dienelactone hydrolase family protein [Rhodovibrionaceae bacterium A322]
MVGKFVALTLALLLVACVPSGPKPVLLDQAENQVVPHLRTFQPEGQGPFPTVILVHGASDKAWHAEYQRLVERFVTQGYAVVYPDLYKGRRSSGQAARSGGLLPKETSGDVMIALDWAEQQPWVRRDEIFAVGVSFGATSIMDALVYDAPGKKPTGLLEKPATSMSDLAGVVLLVPWCKDDVMGLNLIASVKEDFYAKPDTLAVIAGRDSVADNRLCRQILARNQAAGLPLEILEMENQGHTYLQSEDDYGQPFGDYDAAAAEETFDRVFAFMAARR